MTTSDITIAEAARTLGVSERSVWRYLKSGKLDGETVGPIGAQRTLVDPASLAVLAAARGRDPQADELRGERDGLRVQLERAEAERSRLAARVASLQLALAPARRPPVAERVLASAISRLGASRGRPLGWGPRRAA